MATKMYLLRNGKKSFAAEFEGEKVFNFYVAQCKQRNVHHTINEKGDELNIANKIVFKLV